MNDSNASLCSLFRFFSCAVCDQGQLENFSTDPVNYPTSELAAFIKQLRSQGQRYVLIIDPAIHNRTGYDTYESGLQQDVYVKRASGETFIGKVWPGFTAFPSFFPPQTAKWWGDHIAKFRAAVPVDGLWIDMNEASNFCSGDCDSPSERLSSGVAEQSPREQRMLAAKAETIAASKKKSRRSSHTVALASVSASELSSAPAPKGFPRRLPKSLCTGEVGAPVGTCLPNNPPYRINNAGNGANLNSLTIDMDAVHAWGSNKLLEYDVHNLYGFTESIVTNAVMESQMGTRSLLVSRSTFSGSGHHAAHWLGDNWSTWASMAESIPGMLAMQFFGIPLVGADICGFNGDTTEELCARWQALGAFYPFARNHNAKGQISQEPFLWQSVADVTRKTLSVRYSLLHVFNTLLFETHKQGGTVVRPLFLNFAQDPATFAVDAQFMIGSAVLVTPVLTQGATSVTGYFPQVNDAGLPQRWFDLWSGAEFFAGSTGLAQLDAPLSTIPLHYAGGNVIPTQAPGLNTEAQAKNPFNIVVAPDSVGAATGALFLDDGETLQVGSNSTQATFRYANGQLTYALSVNIFAGAAALRAQQVTVLGVAQAPKSATINGKPAAPQTLQYSSQTKVLMLNTLNLLPLNQPFTVAFTF
jgi:alpha-glucosidase (family GH31 glycosyl hydrolase)